MYFSVLLALGLCTEALRAQDGSEEFDPDEHMLQTKSPTMDFLKSVGEMPLRFDIGFTQLKQASEQMELKFLPSTHMQFALSHPFSFFKKRMEFSPGVAIGWNRYSFKKNVRLSHTHPRTDLVEIKDLNIDGGTIDGGTLGSSTFRNFYMGLPVDLIFYPNRYLPTGRIFNYRLPSLFVSVGGYVYYIASSRQRMSYELEGKSHSSRARAPFAIQPLQYGLSFRLGWKGTSLYYNLGLNPLFHEKNGPLRERNATTQRIGLSIRLVNASY